MVHKIYVVVAISENGVIGNKNKIPWNNKEDMQFFRKITEKNCLLMGRNTWISLPNKPLRNRVHFIISSSIMKSFETATEIYNINHIATTIENQQIIFFNDILSGIQHWVNTYSFYKNLFIIGGGKIYESILNEYSSFISGVYCTHIKKKFEGDVYFPVQKMLQLSKNVTYIFSNEDIDINFYEF